MGSKNKDGRQDQSSVLQLYVTTTGVKKWISTMKTKGKKLRSLLVFWFSADNLWVSSLPCVCHFLSSVLTDRAQSHQYPQVHEPLATSSIFHAWWVPLSNSAPTGLVLYRTPVHLHSLSLFLDLFPESCPLPVFQNSPTCVGNKSLVIPKHYCHEFWHVNLTLEGSFPHHSKAVIIPKKMTKVVAAQVWKISTSPPHENTTTR